MSQNGLIAIGVSKYARELREITSRSGLRESTAVRSSVTPSANYAWSGSLLRLQKGSTAMPGRGSGRLRC